jgi:hypothetical protein
MLLCSKCYAAELQVTKEYQAPELQEQRLAEHNKQIKLNELIGEATKIDQSIQLSSDIFNAKTIALVDIMKAIDIDESIVNKPYSKTEYSVNRIKHLVKVIFDCKNQITEAENEIRANQVNVNMLVNTLRDEERAKLKLQDINYQPATPKTPKPKSSGTAKAKKSSKIDMNEVNKWAAKIGMPSQLIHMRMLSKNMNAEAAARTFAAEMNITIKD